jgi:putative selenium metabolism hydrolase
MAEKNVLLDEIREIAAGMDARFMDFCARLVQTPSPSGEEGAVADIVEQELRELGYDEVSRDSWGNVTGILRGLDEGPAILHNGHMDVVPHGDENSWGGYDPYGAAIDDCLTFDRDLKDQEMATVMHGRGTSDMKCCLAAQVYAGAILAELRRRGKAWKGIFVLSAVVMEENGDMLGTIKFMTETLPKLGLDIDAMVCAEPSSLDLKIGHRGRVELEISVYGKSCHGSSPWLGVNAVEKAALLITSIRDYFSAKDGEPADENLGKPSIALTIIGCEPAATCIVPDRCRVLYDRRLAPGESVESALAEIRGLIDELRDADPDFSADVDVCRHMRHSYTGESEVVANQKDAWIIDETHPFIRACVDGLSGVEQEARCSYWHFGTDIPQVGSVMNKPCVGYSGGQEYYIHTCEERIRLDYLRASLEGFVSMYLQASELRKEQFKMD